jgi:hypothetical protein
VKLTIFPSDKGDCLLLESPDGTAILIDGGMRNSYVEHVRPVLGKWRKGDQNRKLDLVYLSHIDQDHIAGVLQLMDDIAEWRVYNYKTTNGGGGKKPGFAEPPEVGGLWHNGFSDLLTRNTGDIASMLAQKATPVALAQRPGKAASLDAASVPTPNVGAIRSMLGARASQLSNSVNPRAVALADAYRSVANSIPESIRLSGRTSSDQLGIPLNDEFDHLLALVRDPPQVIRLNGAASPSI